jgi:hypothetical protein
MRCWLSNLGLQRAEGPASSSAQWHTSFQERHHGNWLPV